MVQRVGAPGANGPTLKQNGLQSCVMNFSEDFLFSDFFKYISPRIVAGQLSLEDVFFIRKLVVGKGTLAPSENLAKLLQYTSDS